MAAKRRRGPLPPPSSPARLRGLTSATKRDMQQIADLPRRAGRKRRRSRRAAIEDGVLGIHMGKG